MWRKRYVSSVKGHINGKIYVLYAESGTQSEIVLRCNLHNNSCYKYIAYLFYTSLYKIV